MDAHCNLPAVAALIADSGRAAMLLALLDGRARPAGELAYAAGVTPQTASSHLAKLLAGGLLAVEASGRHRYYRLAGAEVASALEQLALIAPPATLRPRPLSREARLLRHARCCYDHLAGRLGVAVAQALKRRSFIVPAPDRGLAVTPEGAVWFAGIGCDVAALRPTRLGTVRDCLDWTERTHHIAGPLGRQMLLGFCAAGWLRRAKTSRAVEVTPTGMEAFRRQLGVDASAVPDRAGA